MGVKIDTAVGIVGRTSLKPLNADYVFRSFLYRRVAAAVSPTALKTDGAAIAA